MTSLRITVEYIEETGKYLSHAPWMNEVIETDTWYEAWCIIVARRPR